MGNEKPIFGKILETLMTEDGCIGKSPSRQLARKMLDAGIIEKTELMKEHERKGLEKELTKDKAKVIDYVRRQVENHLAAESAKNVDSKWLFKYAEYFGCSYDYLFGVLPRKTQLHSDIGAVTGLTDRAIEVLRVMKDESQVEFYEKISEDGAMALAMVNELLEASYPRIAIDGERGTPVWLNSLFSTIYEYVHGDEGCEARGLGSEGEFPIEKINFYPNSKSSTEDVKNLYAQYKQNEIISVLDNMRREKSNGNNR